MNGIQLSIPNVHEDGAFGTFQNVEPPATPGTIYVNVKNDATGAEVANVSCPAPNSSGASWATLPWSVTWPELPDGTYSVTAILVVPGAPAPCPTVIKTATFAPPPPPPPPPPAAVIRDFDGAQLLDDDHGFDQFNYAVVLDTAVKTPNGKNTARCSVAGTAHIARCNWFKPPGSGVETQVLAKKGDTIAHGGYYRFRAGDPHQWTQCLRLSDNSQTGGPGSTGPTCVLAVVLANGKVHVDLADYGGDPSGVPNSTPIPDLPFPIDGAWHFIELEALLDDDPAKGRVSLAIDGVVTTKAGRTIKTPTSSFRRSQHGLGDYYNAGGQSAQVHVGDSYLASALRGPS